MTIEFGLLILGSYLLGSVPPAYLAAKWSRGIDIRKHGTGKVGAANILSTAPKWLAIPVTIFDIGKGVLAVWIAQLLGFGAVEQIAVGSITVIGHNWPIFLRFQGGRGIFTSLGVITMLSPKLGLIILAMPYAIAARPYAGQKRLEVALGVFLALVSLPIFSWFLSKPLDIEERMPITLGFVALSLIGLSKRLVARRTALSKSVSKWQLFVNRLLFDRDIKDRKAWINPTPSEQRNS